MKKLLVGVLLTAMLLQVCAMAERIEFTEPVLLPCATTAEGETNDVEVYALDILGRADENVCMVVANDALYYIADEVLLPLTDENFDFDALPDISESMNLNRKRKSEESVNLQNALIELGYLKGKADGFFGNASMAAAQAFEEAYGLNVSDSAEQITMATYLAARALAGHVEETAQEDDVTSAEDVVFPQLHGKTAFRTDAFDNKMFELEFDDFDECGDIKFDESFTWKLEDASALDAMSFEITFGVHVAAGEDGMYVGTPQMIVAAKGPRTPQMEQIAIKAQDVRCDKVIESVETATEGSNVVETVRMEIDSELTDLLRALCESGEAVMRVTGKYRQFDITLQAKDVPGLATYLDAIAQMG